MRDTGSMSDKPSYLGLLNAISNAESDAECYLGAWASTTARADVRQIIATVALREGEHGKAFAKRICELGFDLQRKEAPDVADKMSVAGSTSLSDREKFDRLGLIATFDPAKPDIFSGMFADKSIDIQTGALLGRYIAEERDSGRMFRACYDQLSSEQADSEQANSGGESAKSPRKARIQALEARMAGIEAKLDQLVDARS